MIRLFGNKTDKKATEQAVSDLLNTTAQPVQSDTIQVSNTEHLLTLQIEQLKAQVEQLEKQLEYVKANEAWLKQQLDQKLIEHKSHEKKGLLGRLFG
jgi:molecular chaperone GrpE (heat shock protein)